MTLRGTLVNCQVSDVFGPCEIDTDVEYICKRYLQVTIVINFRINYRKYYIKVMEPTTA